MYRRHVLAASHTQHTHTERETPCRRTDRHALCTSAKKTSFTPWLSFALVRICCAPTEAAYSSASSIVTWAFFCRSFLFPAMQMEISSPTILRSSRTQFFTRANESTSVMSYTSRAPASKDNQTLPQRHHVANTEADSSFARGGGHTPSASR
jgi:hypothetical protein